MLGFSFRRLREERDRMSGSGGRAVDRLWTGGGRAVDGRWTGCGRAGAAEIAWEEARDGGTRSNVRIRWTGSGRAVDWRELQK